MEPGKRYRGYGYLNEYKEFVFEPENTGAREGMIKSICTRDGVSLSHTKENLIIHLKVKKTADRIKMMQAVLSKLNIITKLLQEYEI